MVAHDPPITARFKPGDRVRVRTAVPAGHCRTPGYVRGKAGWIEAVHGAFRNPESLAYGGEGLPKQVLYMVAFDRAQIWSTPRPPSRDTLLADLYEHWLEPA